LVKKTEGILGVKDASHYTLWLSGQKILTI
jgi:hypothetical protein